MFCVGAWILLRGGALLEGRTWTCPDLIVVDILNLIR